MTRPETILEFWFGDDEEGPVPPERFKLWFGGDEATDRLIRERFEADLLRAEGGEYDSWRQTPAGTLALILLFDQFPRNIFRGKAAAYAFDQRALAICSEGMEKELDLTLPTVQRAFFYLPLEHDETMESQNRSVRAFESLLESAPVGVKKMCEGFLDYALRHREIIERFGRYPHRNSALGRPCTAEEEAFLREPGSSF